MEDLKQFVDIRQIFQKYYDRQKAALPDLRTDAGRATISLRRKN